MQSVLAMGLKCVKGKTSICHFLDYVHRKRLFSVGRSSSFQFRYTTGWYLVFVRRRNSAMQFSVIEQCFVWNLQRSCEELVDFP